ncbi:MAG: RNA 2',3'-cyclic phosphodiesterase [Desulfomonilia bacterium]|nr:RNA 2',3'-cyclic phosphodiesterase [Desulfomonilia bacterium]
MIRTFIALTIPGEHKERLASAVSCLKEKNTGVRWVRSAGMHLTLKFLGDIEERLVPELSRDLDDVARAFPPVSLRFSGYGAFPSWKRARVIWIGLSGDNEVLSRLASSVDQVCSRVGVPPERRAFRAHITLGRRKVPSVVDLGIDLIDGEFTSYEVLLYKSELLRTGARYTELHRSRLGHKGG